jgi:hypothetical protein
MRWTELTFGPIALSSSDARMSDTHQRLVLRADKNLEGIAFEEVNSSPAASFLHRHGAG